MNYFSPKAAAGRYVAGRPDVHDYSVGQIKDFLQLHEKMENALDVACGTGLSTKALLPIADNVYGTDTSAEMLAFAPRRDRIRYTLAPAEEQPFSSGFFDLITVSSGVHWFDIPGFLQEARRMLRPRSWLVLYENYFNSAIEGVDDFLFRQWHTEVYSRRFPSPPRNNKYEWTNDGVQPFGLTFVTEIRSTYSVPLTVQQLALYFTTQSNVIARVEAGECTYEEVEDWLEQELSAFFPADGGLRAVSYGNWIKFIRRAD
jgi:ubiquinone/menaquinone biosynthesis C-methylase UbiE